MGSATGGVWMSRNGGLNWRPVFDEEAVASIGGGIYKSADGGKAWTLMGLEQTERINRIALKERLDALEKRFLVPPKTRGIVYSVDKVANRVGMASGFVGSTYDAPSENARTYMRIAESSLQDAVDELNAVLAEDVSALREAAREAGLGLLGQRPVERE